MPSQGRFAPTLPLSALMPLATLLAKPGASPLACRRPNETRLAASQLGATGVPAWKAGSRGGKRSAKRGAGRGPTPWTISYLFVYGPGDTIRCLLTPSWRVHPVKRSRLSRSASRGSFSRGASRTHKRNLFQGNPMRGGIRL